MFSAITRKISIWIISLFLLGFLLVTINIISQANVYKNTIQVHCQNKISKINKKVFGNNLIGYDPKTYETYWKEDFFGYSDYGAGIWDSKWKEPVREVVALARGAGITIARFPGGCGAHHYNWKDAVGADREHFLFGIDEFLQTCQEIGAEVVMTVSYFTGDEQDAAELVEYLNGEASGEMMSRVKALGSRVQGAEWDVLFEKYVRNEDGSLQWANYRVLNGHPEPHNVKYFEIGNEVNHGDHQSIKEVLPEKYAQDYLKYYAAMKAVDSTIKIGIVLVEANWNRRVLEIVGDKVDFVIIHTYPRPAWGRKLELMEPKKIFQICLGLPIVQDEVRFQNTLALLREKARRDIPLAITEYNGGFVQEKPVPYRHCLGNALLNAELLRIFMKPEHNILMANYWNFVNEYWGMVKSKEDFMTHDYRYPITYIKRPNYYVYELYHKHFGSTLLETEVDCNTYNVHGVAIPYLSVNASTNEDGDTVYLMVINKNLDENITTTINLKDFEATARGNAWVLNGPSVDATNEFNSNNVKVRHKEFEIAGNPFEFTFEPHSLTAIEIAGSPVMRDEGRGMRDEE